MKRALAVLLVLVMLSSITNPAFAMTLDIADQGEAKAVVSKFIARISTTDDFRDWKDARIGKTTPVYGVNENITAYIVELVKEWGAMATWIRPN